MTALPAIETNNHLDMLFVSSRLGVRMGRIGGMPIVEGSEEFQPLTLVWYAWLRKQMEKAQAAHKAGKLDSATWESMRRRFNEIHSWAVDRYGQNTLNQAIHGQAQHTTRPSPSVTRQPANHSTFRYPTDRSLRFFEPVEPAAIAKVDAIRDEAIGLGWSMARLYQNQGDLKFPYANYWGLVCFVHGDRRIGEVTREYIEIIHPGVKVTTNRFFNMEVEQPWLKRVTPTSK